MQLLPKKLFFIWFGNNIPSYVNFCIQSFQQLNTNFEIIFVHRTITDIENIYNNKNIKNIYDKVLKQAINLILNSNNSIYNEYINNQIQLYKSDIRFIQLLSDIYRVYLVNYLGGIYLDCDTFALKPFNDILLKQEFCVAKYYSTNIKSIDNYFFGFIKKENEQHHIIPIPKKNLNILQLLQSDIYENKTEFQLYKKQFFSCKLMNKDIKNNKNFYIKHFSKNSWNTKNCISIPKCKFDKFLEICKI